MTEAFFVMLIVFVVVVLVGHGIWVGAEWLLRQLQGLAEPDRGARPCVFCHKMTPRHVSHCCYCGRDLDRPEAVRLRDLEGFERSLDRMLTAGLISTDEWQSLAARGSELRASLSAVAQPAEEPSVIAVEIVPEPPRSRETPQPAPQPSPPLRPSESPRPRPQTWVQQPAPKPVVSSAVAPPSAAHPVPERQIEAPRQAEVATSPEGPRALCVAEVLSEAPAPTSKSFGEMLVEFMEPHNIRWGEVIGGLLFVIGAAALVGSQWEALQRYWLFRFGVAAAVTSAVFGVGLYCYHRWRLEATGRGLLLISTLLVPLNFLAMGGLDQAGPWPTSLALQAAALALFAWFLYLAGRVLVPRGAGVMAGTIAGLSALTPLLTRGSGALDPAWTLSAVGGLAALGHAAGLGTHCVQCARSRRWTSRRAVGLLSFAGAATFALVVVVGLAAVDVLQDAGPTVMFHHLALPLALAAGPLLVTGLLIQRRAQTTRSMEGLALAGRWLALVSGVAMVAALAMAWPVPWWIIAVGSLCTALLAGGAVWFRFPLVHGGAIVCATLVYLVTVFLIRGDLAVTPDEQAGLDLLRLLATARSGTALVGWCALLGVVAGWLARRQRADDARVYAGGVGLIALASVVLVTLAQPGDALRAAIVYGLYGLSALGLNLRLRRPWVSYVGLSLLSGQAAWLLWWHCQRIEPLWAACLAALSLAMTVTAMLLARFLGPTLACVPAGADDRRFGLSDLQRVYVEPLWHLGEVLAAAAMTLGVVSAWFDRAFLHDQPALVIATALVCTVYTLIGWRTRSAGRVWLASVVLGVGLVHALVCNYEVAPLPWSMALLGHATLTLCGSFVAARAAGSQGGLQSRAEEIVSVFVEPLLASAAVSSAFAALSLGVSFWPLSAALCYGVFWLAAIWLVLAIQLRQPGWLAAHQAALALAVSLAIAFWYEHLPGADGWLTLPQAIGCGLTLVALLWLAVRLLLRSHPEAERLLNPDWLMVDQLLKHAVVVTLLLLLLPGLVAGTMAELVGYGNPEALAWLTTHCFNAGAWLWLALATAVLVVSLWQRWAEADLCLAVVLSAAAVGLTAGQFAESVAVGSALRWGLAVDLLFVSLMLWVRTPVLRWLHTAGCRIETAAHAAQVARGTALAATALPLLALTIQAAVVQFSGLGPQGPSGGLFSEINALQSYLAPLAVLVVCLIGHAIGERSAGYAFSAGLIVKLAVAMGYTLWLHTHGAPFDVGHLVCLLQLLSLTAGVWGLGWMTSRRWLDVWPGGSPGNGLSQGSGSASGLISESSSDHSDPLGPSWGTLLMSVQVALGGVLCGTWLAWALAELYVLAPSQYLGLPEAVLPLGWLSLLAASAAGIWHLRQVVPWQVFHVLAGLVSGCILLGACTSVRIWPDRPVLTLQAGMFGLVAAAFVVLLLGWLGRAGLKWLVRGSGEGYDAASMPGALRVLAEAWFKLVPAAEAVQAWGDVLGALAVALALRWSLEPALPMRALVAVILTVGVHQALMGLWLRQSRSVYVSALLVNVAATLVWLRTEQHSWILLGHLNSLALAVAATAWAVAEQIWPRRIDYGEIRPLPHLAVPVAVLLEAFTVAVCLVDAATGGGVGLGQWLADCGTRWPIWAQAAAVLAMIVLLWDRSARFHLWAIYVTGLSALATAVLLEGEGPFVLAWQAAPILAVFVLGAAGLARVGPQWEQWAPTLRIPVGLDRWSVAWFGPAQAVLALAATMLCVWVAWDIGFDRWGYVGYAWCSGRFAGVLGLLALVPSCVVMAGLGSPAARPLWRDATLAVLVLLLSALGWAWLDAQIDLPWTHRGVVLLIASVMTMLAAEGLVRAVPADSGWRSTTRRVLPYLATLAGVLLLLVLGQEFRFLAGDSDSPLALWAELSVAAMLAAMLAGCLLAALAPGWDPLALSLRGRTLYVYLAEVCMVLLALHVRLAFPEFFTRHLLQRYGLLLAMAVAFLWGGLAEVFRRRRLEVLAKPLERTALLLPVLPMIAFWFVPVRPTAVWLLIALFYGCLAGLRRSSWLAALAVAAGNVGLWVLWHRWEIGFAEHPQLWLIPPALAALVAEHLGRGRLPRSQGAAVRYLALGIVYVSSTADMFIAGIGNSLWLPLLLVGLCLLGVLLGMALRIQSFLNLGVTFLVVVMGTMLKYVTLDLGQTWVLWLTLVGLGAAILTMVGLFEKRRNEIRAALGRFREWER